MQTGPRAGIEINDETVGIERDRVTTLTLEPPLRHVELERVEIGEEGERGEVVDEGKTGSRRPTNPVGSSSRHILLEELHVVDAVRIADPG